MVCLTEISISPNDRVHDTTLLCALEGCRRSQLHTLKQALDVWTLQLVTFQPLACAAVTFTGCRVSGGPKECTILLSTNRESRLVKLKNAPERRGLRAC